MPPALRALTQAAAPRRRSAPTRGNPSCAAYFQCVGACALGDLQCRSQCLLDHPLGASPQYAPLSACVARSCETACHLTCGALDYFAPPDTAASCQECLNNSGFCAAESACASSVDCVAYAQCLRRCMSPDCRLACAVTTDAGQVASIRDAGAPAIANAPYAGAIDPTGACNASCAVGGNWTCVGRVSSWPGGTPGPTTLVSKVVDYAGAPTDFAGTGVALCRFSDPLCTNPIASATADQKGDVVLPVPSSPLGFAPDDFVQVTSDAGTFLPVMYFLGYPVTEPLAPIAQPYLGVLTTTELPGFEAILGLDAGVSSATASPGFEVFDCNGFPAPGVQVTIEPSASPAAEEWYANPGATPSFAATATDSTGIGQFLYYAPTGAVTLTATPEGLSQPSCRANVIARDGWFSTAFMSPVTGNSEKARTHRPGPRA